ncbi:MAG: DUF4349 domain-containing protein [Bacteroidota bacterium]
MKSRIPALFSFAALLAIVLTACGAPAATPAAAPTQAPPMEGAPQLYRDATGNAGPQAPEMPGAVLPAEQPADQSKALALPTAGVIYSGQDSSGANAPAGRMIIKNADMRLLVEDTDVAIDRTTQLVGDLGGYIISSRTWVQDYYQFKLKYATLTIGMPVEQFERALTRLRGLSVQVLDETASGEDVTDQYVDLESQLTNLEATRERIKSFLADAKNVDEALRINQQLSDIERQIEQIKGQINYLQDRSAFSTITVNLEPKLPELVATPTPTPTPVTWKPGDTYKDAQKTLTAAYQGIAEFLIWFFVVLVPILLPPLLILWGVWRLLRRRPPNQG